MTDFELWVKGCEVNKAELYCLEGNGETGLYETKSKYLHNYNYYYNRSVFHVWINGKCEFSGMDHMTALRLFAKRRKRNEVEIY